MALTLILHHQAEILQARSMVEVCERFKLITQGDFTYDCHTFMQVSYSRREVTLGKGLGSVPNLNVKCSRVTIRYPTVIVFN